MTTSTSTSGPWIDAMSAQLDQRDVPFGDLVAGRRDLDDLTLAEAILEYGRLGVRHGYRRSVAAFVRAVPTLSEQRNAMIAAILVERDWLVEREHLDESDAYARIRATHADLPGIDANVEAAPLVRDLMISRYESFMTDPALTPRRPAPARLWERSLVAVAVLAITLSGWFAFTTKAHVADEKEKLASDKQKLANEKTEFADACAEEREALRLQTEDLAARNASWRKRVQRLIAINKRAIEIQEEDPERWANIQTESSISLLFAAELIEEGARDEELFEFFMTALHDLVDTHFRIENNETSDAP